MACSIECIVILHFPNKTIKRLKTSGGYQIIRDMVLQVFETDKLSFLVSIREREKKTSENIYAQMAVANRFRR